MVKDLKEYNEKRDFEKTKEPKGSPVKTLGKKKLNYVIQHHLARRDHYDFRIEWDGALLSWAVPKGPSLNPDDKRLAVEVEPHPLDYKDFEGVIPKGEYGGGTVMLWDEGSWEPISDPEKGLADGSLKFTLNGKRLKGKWALVRLKPKKEGENNWLLVKDKDEYAKDYDGLADYPTSVRTGRTMEEIEHGESKEFYKNPFDNAELQLAKLVNSVPEGDWLYEIKYDGYRIAAYVEENGVRLISRNGKDFSHYFKDVVSSLAEFSRGRAAVLDGEMVVVDPSGKTDFQALQNRLKNNTGGAVTYVIFDILALDGEDLRDKKLTERKSILENFLKGAPGNIHYSRHIKGDGKKFLDAACKNGLEGIIAKRADSVYGGARNGDWIKLKCGKRQEFVIGGYTLSEKQSYGLSSILLGYYQDGKLVYAGRAGTGFTEKFRKELSGELDTMRIKESPFESFNDKKPGEKVFFVSPQKVAEVRFAEWTKDNLLRQASFKGIRADKAPLDVKREDEEPEMEEDIMPQKTTPKSRLKEGETEIAGIRVTNAAKVIFDNPQTTKGEIVEYYSKVAERMLPYAGNRLLSIVRCPKGVNDQCFFKKHPGPGHKNIVVTPVASAGGIEEYFYIDDPKGIIYEAQMGTIEFHAWGSRIDNLEKPDMMVFDLDPDEGMALDRVRQGVLDLKSVLDKLSLTAFLKTSGGKGYHIVVPFTPLAGWDAFNTFARQIAELMASSWPDRYTSNIRKNKREGKIFIDWVRNGRGATSVVPYSVRAREGAKVAMPIFWEELNTIPPDGITIANALKRLQTPDPWEDYLDVEQKQKIK